MYLFMVTWRSVQYIYYSLKLCNYVDIPHNYKEYSTTEIKGILD